MNDSSSTIADLAANLRRLRVAAHLSLSELARATGISKATLSGIERGAGNPTVETLAALAGALRVSLGELLERPELAPIRIVRGGRPADGGEIRRTLEGPALGGGGALEALELNLPAGHVEQLAPQAPGSRTLLYVLRGKLIAGPVERVSELVAGDYASFPADVPRQVEAAGARPARALLLVQPA
ncbi:MAG TPA: XRE family transcriptional regulator [Thermoleophilaceae bacterium]|nr:XRE family transcriptional regulator [Thermoleophilaceae bacterium]